MYLGILFSTMTYWLNLHTHYKIKSFIGLQTKVMFIALFLNYLQCCYITASPNDDDDDDNGNVRDSGLEK